MRFNSEEEKKLLAEMKELDNQVKVRRDRLNKLYDDKNEVINQRIVKANQGHGDFHLDELLFAANSVCKCGAGMCYPDASINIHGAWYCSAILRGIADREKVHTDALPFAFYEIKSEDQPSADGMTTRPKLEPENG